MSEQKTKPSNDDASGTPTSVILLPDAVLVNGGADGLRPHAAIRIQGNRVAEVDEAQSVLQAHSDATVLDLPNCLVMPGLVNAHQHGRGLSDLQQGIRDDLLELVIAARIARRPQDCEPFVSLACAQMLRNGVTSTIQSNVTFGNDYEAEIRTMLKTYDKAGIRATVCIGAQDQGQIVYPQEDESAFLATLPDDLQRLLSARTRRSYAGDGPATVALMDRLLADYGNHPRVKLLYGPAGPQWTSDELFACLVDAAHNQGVAFHLHCLETRAQRAALNRMYPEGTLQHLDNLGVLSPRSSLAHCVFMSPPDIDVAAKREVTIVHNPGSNLRLHNGAAPVGEFIERGIRVAIGTDNRALEPGEDLLKEIRLAQGLARSSKWKGPPPLGASDLLTMATVNGARAATVEDEVGTLEVGMKADLVAISLDRVFGAYLDEDVPVLEAVMARAEGRDVRLTMVEGRVLFKDGALLSMDEAEARERARQAAEAPNKRIDVGDRRLVQDLCDRLTDHYRNMTAPG
jgi:cytosine/adenosine deaminase-related metal-dependent hydrolase